MFWVHKNATYVALVSQHKKDVLATIGVTKYINPKIQSEGSFHVLCDKLDKLARQRQAVNSHLQICESCTIDFYTGTNQVLMSDNPKSQRFLEIFLD